VVKSEEAVEADQLIPSDDIITEFGADPVAIQIEPFHAICLTPPINASAEVTAVQVEALDEYARG
jgi:hypothetical protein